MHPSLPNQVASFMSILATAARTPVILVPEVSLPEAHTSADMTPCKVQVESPTQAFNLEELLSLWLPSVDDLVSGLQLRQSDFDTNPQPLQIQDYGALVAQFSPQLCFAPPDRSIFSEQSLTRADYRHAVDHLFELTQSPWQNN